MEVIQNTDGLLNNKNLVHYTVLKEQCRQWLRFESSISPITEDESSIDTCLWYHICTLNLFADEADIQRRFRINADNRAIVVRLVQLYITCVMIIGEEEMEYYHKVLDSTLRKFKIKSYSHYRKKYPFIVLIPFLNSIILEDITLIQRPSAALKSVVSAE